MSRSKLNAMFIVLFRSFLANWSCIYTDICFRKKRLNYALSYNFEIFKGMSHNLELLCFQKMCGLLRFMRKTKALQRSARVLSWRVAGTFSCHRVHDLNSPHIFGDISFNFSSENLIICQAPWSSLTIIFTADTGSFSWQHIDTN